MAVKPQPGDSSSYMRPVTPATSIHPANPAMAPDAMNVPQMTGRAGKRPLTSAARADAPTARMRKPPGVRVM